MLSESKICELGVAFESYIADRTCAEAIMARSVQARRSLGLYVLGCWHFELSAKNPVPEAAGDAEPIIVVGEMVL